MNAFAEDAAYVAAAATGPRALPLGLIKPNQWNRKHNPALQADLNESVRKHGVLQAILVRPIDGAKAGEPQYEIVCGERRYIASLAAKLGVIPCSVRPMTDLEVVELMLVENLEREHLHELDEAEGYERLLRRKDGLQGFATVDELAARIHKSRSYVMKRRKLLALSDKVKAAFREGPLPFSHALLIARIPTPEGQAEALHDMLHGFGGNMMSQRDAEAYVQRTFMLDLSGAVFKITDATLVPAAGSCRDCSKRTGSNPDLFDDVKKGDTCTDSACFQGKVAAHAARQRAEAEAAGQKVLTAAEAKKLKDTLLPLDEADYRIDDRPLRKLLGKQAPEVTMVEDARSGTFVPMVSEKAAMAILKERGVVKQAKMPSGSASERERASKAKAETAWRMAVAAECVDKAGAADCPAEFRSRLLWVLAARVWRDQGHDSQQRLFKLLGWPPLRASWQSGPGTTADQHIDSLNADQLARFFAAVAVVGELHVAQHQDLSRSKPDVLLDMAQRLGVDAKATRERLRDVKRAEPAGKAAAKARAKAAEVTPETALAGALKAAAAKKKVLPRYRDPRTGDTWSGRGLQPKWLRAQLVAGKKLSDFDMASVPPKAVISNAAAAGLADPTK